MALIYSDANPTNVYALDSDVLLGVAARLDIQDILALRLVRNSPSFTSVVDHFY